MNRSLLLVICDFLLLSLLALARFEPPEGEAGPEAGETGPAPPPEADLVATLQETLAAESEERQQLAATAEATAAELAEREAALAEREAALRERTEALEAARADAERLERERAEIAEARAALEAQRQREAQERQTAEARLETAREELAAARAEQAELAESLGSTRTAADVSRERLAELQKLLQEREAALEAARQEARQRANAAAAEQQARTQLEQRLAVVQAEAEAVRESLERTQQNFAASAEQNRAVREQTERLFDNLQRLSAAQDRMAEEVAASRPQSVNQVYEAHLRRLVTVDLSTRESLLLGDRVRDFALPGLVVTLRGQAGVVFPLDQTPLNRSSLRRVSVEVAKGDQTLQARALARLQADPRLGWVPLSAAELEQLGVEPAQAANDPTAASEAILIGAAPERGYGMVPYRLMPQAPRHLTLMRGGIEKLFGDLNPARRDWLYLPDGNWLGSLVGDEVGVLAGSAPTTGPGRLRLQPAPGVADVQGWAERGALAEEELPEAVR
ncbi:MAG: hypothetical protein ACFB21_12585 [Opitutales bacterium]